MAPIILGYWDIRGLATSIRLTLEQANAPYEDKLYHKGGPPDFECGKWLNDKFSMGFDFPNLPYLIDGDVKLTQSLVILRYLGNKYNLAGVNMAERLRADLLSTQIMDYLVDYEHVAYNPNFNTLKDGYSKALPDKFKLLEKFVDSKKFAVGKNVTYADLLLFEFLEGQLHFDPEALKEFPILEKFRQSVLALEAIDRYFKSSKAIKLPFNGSPAYFGGAYSAELQKLNE